MIDKNDPLIGVVQGVMNRNHAEREAVKLVNEKFGIQDRKALPHERQHEWDAAYKSVLTEGVNVPDISYKKTEKNGNSDTTIMTKDTKNVFSGGTRTYQNVDKTGNSNNGSTLTTKIKSQDLGKNKQLGGKDYNVSSSTVFKKSSTSVDEEALDEKSFAALAPPYDKATQKDRLVGAGVLKKHPTQPNKHILAKEGSDVTSPSSMGIKKPNYAPAGTTPDYANKGPQMVNRAAKTSLPVGTVAKSIKEAGPGFAGAGSQVRGQSTYGSGSAGQQVGKPRVDAKAQGFPARPAASPSTSGTSTAFGGRPAPSGAINNLGRRSQNPVGGAVKNAATAAPAAAKPAAKQVTPVRKAAPAAGTAVTRMRQVRQRDKNNEVG